MRLLKARVLVYSGQYQFAFSADTKGRPKYAILSHRWEEDELTFQEASDPTPWSLESNRKGHKKIVDAARKALEYGLEWIWCDTCCIDKLSSAELSEAINSMFRWYQKSSICIVYLSDILTQPLTDSKWFERAWTLQELIAPPKLVFFDSKWEFISTKHDKIDELVQRTRIDKTVLGEGASRLRHCSVAQKMSWAAGRIASRSEDTAYSLLGLFDVNMPMLYGEGKKAFVRLQEEIIKREADQTVFVFFPEESPETSDETTNSLFALSPAQFARCNTIRQQYLKRKPFVINNLGLEIEVNLRPYDHEAYVAYLPVVNSSSPYPITLRLDVLADSHLFYRTAASLKGPRGRVGPQITQTRRITILRDHVASERPKQTLYGFRFANTHHNITLVNGWDREKRWDLGIWEPDSSSTTQPPLTCFKFSIPKGVSASIAMLTLTVRGDLFLMQLAYDFDFNPCCRVSKLNTSLQEYFSRHTGLNDDGTNWIYDTVNWNQNLRHVDRDETNTNVKSWAAKGLDRQNFKADVPVSITRSFARPQAQITISFAKAAIPDGEEVSNAWSFDLQSNLGPGWVQPGGHVDIVNLRDYDGNDNIIAAREGSPMVEGLKRGSAFGAEAAERFTKRVDTSPI